MDSPPGGSGGETEVNNFFRKHLEFRFSYIDLPLSSQKSTLWILDLTIVHTRHNLSDATPSTTDDQYSSIRHLDLSSRIHRGEQVGWGSYSDIWRGALFHDHRYWGPARDIAIKTLRVRHTTNQRSDTPAEERLRKRFFREILLWADLRHENIVPLLGYMVRDGIPSFVSPWYPSGNLRDYLESNPNANRLSLVSDVAEALSYLHSIPVVHGDIKGENVLVNARGVACICDFGLSQFLDEALKITGFTTTQSNIGGTDRYLCPELLEEEEKTTMSDMWAFACLIMLVRLPLTVPPLENSADFAQDPNG
ncbi:hypothetical protein FRC02_000567 [Tulasnella sp. 418]|nr:hypothetical protein FRC02_000567 [Tulasnella sp. 418]